MVRALVCHDVTKRFWRAPRGVLGLVWTCFGGRPPDTRTVVDRVSFEVPPGEIFGILGPNGSGKSTLIRMIATLLTPDEGHVRVFGHDVTADTRAVQAMINRVSVDAALFKKLSATENLLFTARIYGLETATARRSIERLLAEAGFDASQRHAPVETFSRGMQQRVAIARALLTEPRLLLLDEPTTGLDIRSRLEVQRTIRTLRATRGTTILLTTHDMDEAEVLCDRIAVIDRGRFVAVGTAEELARRLPRPAGRQRLQAVVLHLTRGPASEPEDQPTVSAAA